MLLAMLIPIHFLADVYKIRVNELVLIQVYNLCERYIEMLEF